MVSEHLYYEMDISYVDYGWGNCGELKGHVLHTH